MVNNYDFLSLISSIIILYLSQINCINLCYFLNFHELNQLLSFLIYVLLVVLIALFKIPYRFIQHLAQIKAKIFYLSSRYPVLTFHEKRKKITFLRIWIMRVILYLFFNLIKYFKIVINIKLIFYFLELLIH